MEIEDAGLAIESIDAPQRTAEQRVRQQPEEPSATAWQVALAEPDRGHRQLEQPARPEAEGKARRVGHAVQVVADRVDARAVLVAGFLQHVECPEVARVDRVARRAVADHARAAEVLEDRLGAQHVGAEPGRLEVEHLRVVVAVARELVAVGDDPPDQAGWRSAIQPSTKNVARAPLRANRSSTREVLSCTREG